MEDEAGSERTPAPKRSFANVAKVIIAGLALLSIGLLLGYFFTNHVVTISDKGGKTTTPTPNTTQEQPTDTSQQVGQSPTPTKSQTTKTVSGGLGGNATSFKQYTLKVPSGWTETRENDGSAIDIDRLTITKGSYSLIIYQAAFGGGGCVYGNEPDQPFAQKFSNYAEISGGQYRRSWDKSTGSTNSYTVCQKGSDGSYGSPTQHGAISVKSPEPADAATMAEIDAMIDSIKQQ